MEGVCFWTICGFGQCSVIVCSFYHVVNVHECNAVLRRLSCMVDLFWCIWYDMYFSGMCIWPSTIDHFIVFTGLRVMHSCVAIHCGEFHRCCNDCMSRWCLLYISGLLLPWYLSLLGGWCCRFVSICGCSLQ